MQWNRHWASLRGTGLPQGSPGRWVGRLQITRILAQLSERRIRGRVGERRATSLKPARLNAEASPV